MERKVHPWLYNMYLVPLVLQQRTMGFDTYEPTKEEPLPPWVIYYPTDPASVAGDSGAMNAWFGLAFMGRN